MYHVSVLQILDLYKRRGHIDTLALIRPSLITFFNEIYEWIRCRFYLDKRNEDLRGLQDKMSRQMCAIVDMDGLLEIQSNNMQESQIDKVNTLMGTFSKV